MYLGIDLGTSAIKLVVLHEGVMVAQASADLTVSSPRPGWSEQAPADWWQALRAACSELDLSGVTAIGLSGQMHGAVLLNKDNVVLGPGILWNDNRSVSAAQEMQARCPDVGQRAGVLPLPGFTAPKLIWLRAREPDTWQQVRAVVLPKDYIGYRLHGALATDRSDAAGTLWLNQVTRDWDDVLCAASDTDPGWLPALHDGSDVVGEVTVEAARELGLPAGIPVVAGGGDAATGALSVGAVTPGAGFMGVNGALGVGIAAGALCAYAVRLKFRFGYDDALDVVGVHMVGGLVGGIMIGFLADPEAFPLDDGELAFDEGLFNGGGFGLLGEQIFANLFGLVFAFVVTYVIARVLDAAIGLRVDEEAEQLGLDQNEHAESAYN